MIHFSNQVIRDFILVGLICRKWYTDRDAEFQKGLLDQENLSAKLEQVENGKAIGWFIFLQLFLCPTANHCGWGGGGGSVIATLQTQVKP